MSLIKCLHFWYSLISIRQKHNFDVSHNLTWNCFLVSENLPRFEKICGTGTQNCFCFEFLMCKTILCSQPCKNSQKWVKNQKSTDKHLSFDGLIQEDIDLSDIYLAVPKKKSSSDLTVQIYILWPGLYSIPLLTHRCCMIMSVELWILKNRFSISGI